jgi:mannosyl-oligosaccharide alpha-1,2-mannosidase
VRQGLLPVYINLETGAATSAQFAMGALSDSYYEYLLKVWVLKGRTDEMYRAMWVRAMDEMLERLVGTSSDGLQYVGDLNGWGSACILAIMQPSCTR